MVNAPQSPIIVAALTKNNQHNSFLNIWQPFFILCKLIFLAKEMLCSMLVLLRPMKLIQPKYNIVVAGLTHM